MRGFWGGSEAAVVQGGWGVSAVLRGTCVPSCGERGPRPHLGHFARFAASAEDRRQLDFVIRVTAPPSPAGAPSNP